MTLARVSARTRPCSFDGEGEYFRFRFLALLGACTSFDAADPPSEEGGGISPVDTDSGMPVVTGTPDHGIAMTVGAPNATAFVMQGGTLALPITLTRKASSQEAVAVTVKGLPSKVTADALVIPARALTGTITLRADVGSAQGPSAIEIVALEEVAQGAGTSAKLTTFVRGTPGAVDTTFGGQGIVRHIFGSAKAAVAKDLLIFDDGHIGAVAQCGFYACISRTSADGILDATYGTSGVGSVILSSFGTFGQAGVDGSGRVYLSGNGGASSILIGRLTPTGQTDVTYNSTGLSPGVQQYGLGPPEGVRTSLAVRKDGTAFIGVAYDPAGPTSRVGLRIIDPTGVTITNFATGGFSQGNVMQGGTVPVIGLRAGGNVWAASLNSNGISCTFQQVDGSTGVMDPAFAPPGGALTPDIGNSSALDLAVGGAAEFLTDHCSRPFTAAGTSRSARS